RLPGPVLLVARLLADEEDPRARQPFAEDRLGARPPKRTGLADARSFAEGPQRGALGDERSGGLDRGSRGHGGGPFGQLPYRERESTANRAESGAAFFLAERAPVSLAPLKRTSARASLLALPNESSDRSENTSSEDLDAPPGRISNRMPGLPSLYVFDPRHGCGLAAVPWPGRSRRIDGE